MRYDIYMSLGAKWLIFETERCPRAESLGNTGLKYVGDMKKCTKKYHWRYYGGENTCKTQLA